jgi:hypothetical protein
MLIKLKRRLRLFWSIENIGNVCFDNALLENLTIKVSRNLKHKK